MNERILRIIDTAVWKIRRNKVNIKSMHLIRLDTEVIVRENGQMLIGTDVKTHKHVSLAAVGGLLKIGDNVFFNRNCIVACRKEIIIGDRCAFGPNVVIYDHDHKFTTEGIKVNEFNTTPIIIGKNCWIGANVTILRGTHIGEGCVIGAGTIIKGDIPPHSLVISGRELTIESIKRKE